jgi:cysteinyl-tRNA synthetase
MEAGARIEVDPSKRDPMDFALWKAARPGEPSWESPWGPGRPGWHIECSALSMKFLGTSFDIHAGGIDLVFPHHENEIAQSEAATGVEPFARYWTHWGPVNIDGTKMSKSLDNFFTVREILEKVSAPVLRLYLLSTHYRSPIEYVPERLLETAKSYERMQTALSVADQIAKGAPGEPVAELVARFGEAMDDDFNTAQAIGIIFEAVSDLNKELAAPTPEPHAIASLVATVRTLTGQLGITLSESVAHDATSQLIELAIGWRKAAREAKLYALSDAIRDDLAAIGVLLEDRPQGTTWRYK